MTSFKYRIDPRFCDRILQLRNFLIVKLTEFHYWSKTMLPNRRKRLGLRGACIFILFSFLFFFVFSACLYTPFQAKSVRVDSIIDRYYSMTSSGSWGNKEDSYVPIKLTTKYNLVSTHEFKQIEIRRHPHLLSLVNRKTNIVKWHGYIRSIYDVNGDLNGIFVSVTRSPWEPSFFGRVCYHQKTSKDITDNCTISIGNSGFLSWPMDLMVPQGDIAIVLSVVGLTLSTGSPVSIPVSGILGKDWEGSVTYKLERIAESKECADFVIFVIASGMSRCRTILRLKGIILIDSKKLVVGCRMQSKRTWIGSIRTGHFRKKFLVCTVDNTVITKEGEVGRGSALSLR